MITAVIKRPPDEPTRYSPEVRKALTSTHDNRTADIVCAIMDDLDLNQRTVLRKLNYKHRIMTMWVKIRTLVDTMLNLVIDGKDLLLRIHANESNFDWFKNNFGDGAISSM